MALALTAGFARTSLCSAINRIGSQEEAVERGKMIHDNILTIDTHVDIDIDPASKILDLGSCLEKRKVDLVKMKEGGLDGVFFAVWVPQKGLTDRGYAAAYKQAMTLFRAIHRMCEELNSDMIELALSPDDVYRIAGKGKLVAMIGVENGYPLGMDITRVKEFYDLGARYITLTHMGYNQLGDSSNASKGIPAQKYGGLTDFGRQVVQEMNRSPLSVLRTSFPRKGQD